MSNKENAFTSKDLDVLSLVSDNVRALDPTELDAEANRPVPLSSMRFLVADDSSLMRMALSRSLKNLGFENITTVSNGKEAIAQLRGGSFDLILLDIEMPEMTGLEVLEVMKAMKIVDIPVIVISGGSDSEDAIRCIEMGAEDYLPKSFNPVLLRARVMNALNKKQLRDLDKKRLDTIRRQHEMVTREKELSDNLLLNILPREISGRLKGGEEIIADAHDSVTILFGDLSGFTAMSRTMSAIRLVTVLNGIFSEFDRITHRHGVEKIKTIGDCYMAAAGLTAGHRDHAGALVTVAFEMLQAVTAVNDAYNLDLKMRIGLNSGNAVAGVIGLRKFTYDLWGDAVNIASRMESTGEAGRVHISANTARLLSPAFELEERGLVEVKGAGSMLTYYVKSCPCQPYIGIEDARPEEM
jgi:class 3 adenylate cyclase/CheY-like chemotaxis protein